MIPFETGSLKNQFKDTFHIAVEHSLFQFAVLYTCHDVLILLVIAGLQHVIASLHLLHSILATKPVSHHHPFKSPFVAQKCSLQLRILGGINTIHIVIGRHDGPGFRFFHCDFKTFQINLTQSTGRYLCIICHTVRLLVIDGKMLDGSSHTIALYTTYVCSCNLSTYQGVFRIILKIASAKRMPLDIQSGRQQHIRTIFQHLVADSFTHIFYEFLVPGRSKQGSYRKMCTIIGSRIPLTCRVDA